MRPACSLESRFCGPALTSSAVTDRRRVVLPPPPPLEFGVAGARCGAGLGGVLRRCCSSIIRRI